MCLFINLGYLFIFIYFLIYVYKLIIVKFILYIKLLVNKKKFSIWIVLINKRYE